MKLTVNSDECWLIREALLSYRSGDNMRLLAKLADQYDLFSHPDMIRKGSL